MNIPGWEEFLAEHPELGELPGSRPLSRVATFDTRRGSSAVMTADGQVGLWIKLNPFQAAQWSKALEFLPCPDLEAYDDLDAAFDAEAYHQAALHFLSQRIVEWTFPLRRVIQSLGWGGHVLTNYEETFRPDDLT